MSVRVFRCSGVAFQFVCGLDRCSFEFHSVNEKVKGLGQVTCMTVGELALRLSVDVASAGAASAVISPFILLVDKSIIESASGRSQGIIASVRSSLSGLARKPTSFFLSFPFALIWV